MRAVSRTMRWKRAATWPGGIWNAYRQYRVIRPDLTRWQAMKAANLYFHWWVWCGP